MRLRRMGHEGSALDGVSPALRAGASDFGKTQSHQRSSPPTSRPPTADSLISLSGSDGTPQMVHPCTNCGCAVIPDGALDPLSSTRRLEGGFNTVPTHSPHLIADMLPLPLGEGWGEGRFRTSAHPAAHLKRQLLTNSLKLLRLFSLPSSHAPIRALKIAKRQSISRENFMEAIVDIAQVTGSDWELKLRGGSIPDIKYSSL